MLKPDEFRAIAADLEEISLRVGEDDEFTLQAIIEILAAEANLMEYEAQEEIRPPAPPRPIVDKPPAIEGRGI